MIRISIAGNDRPLSEADDGWVNDQIGRRLEFGQVVCVEVSISEPDIKLCLQTPACASSGGGARPPNRREKQIVDLWIEHRLNTTAFTKADVNAFVKQLKNLV